MLYSASKDYALTRIQEIDRILRIDRYCDIGCELRGCRHLVLQKERGNLSFSLGAQLETFEERSGTMQKVDPWDALAEFIGEVVPKLESYRKKNVNKYYREKELEYREYSKLERYKNRVRVIDCFLIPLTKFGSALNRRNVPMSSMYPGSDNFVPEKVYTSRVTGAGSGGNIHEKEKTLPDPTETPNDIP